jgi:acetyl-CoA synthetase
VSGFVWTPPPDLVERANVSRFMRAHGIPTVAELRRRSVADTSWFWKAALEDLGVEWDAPFRAVQDRSRGFPWTRWFPGGRLNLARNCLDRGGPADPAVIWEGDDGAAAVWDRARLRRESSRIASALRRLGVGPGDAVGLYLPMIPELVAAFFACLKIGAVAVPVFSAYAAPALAARLRDSGAKVLLTADGVSRRGKRSPLKPEADLAAAECPALRRIAVFPRLGLDVPMSPGRDLSWDEFLGGADDDVPAEFLDAEAVSLILYTSGTTGRPKGTVHTHAGVLAQCAKEVGYAFDVKPGDVFFWVTDIGWMMGPWELVGALFHGAAVVIFEGAPNHPDPGRLWELCARRRVTHLGVSPTAIRLLKASGPGWVRKHDLSALRILGSTGEPWDPDSWRWYFEEAGGRRCPVINISGGTEIMGCHLHPLPVEPLKPCSLGGPGLGMDVDIFGDDGRPLRQGIGHLVCKQPAPSMTKGFLQDPERYLETYFTRFGPEVWYHGDWASVDADGCWFLHGRSDDTLKIAGKRVGPAEVESALALHPDVAESAAVGVPHEIKGEALLCFVVLKPGRAPSEPLREALAEAVVRNLGKTLRPEAVRFVKTLPKTRSAKILRGAIRRRWLGLPLGDVSSVENPDAIEEIGRST